MEQTLIISQIIFAVLFVLSVLMQEKGSAMSLTFGGGENETFYGNKQGIDKFLTYSSYIFSVLFILNAVSYMLLF